MNRDLQRLNVRHPWVHEPDLFLQAIERLLGTSRLRYDRLWGYYRNPMRFHPVVNGSTSERPYRQAQEWGLPARITGNLSGTELFSESPHESALRKEVVIENDIGWRIDLMVDFLFGKPIVINSACSDPQRARRIETLLRQVLACNGGLIFLQQLAVLGAVYGTVDILVKYVPEQADDPSRSICATQLLGDNVSLNSFDLKPSVTSSQAHPSVPASVDSPDDGPSPVPGPGSDRSDPDPTRVLQHLAKMIRFEIVEPTRALPWLDPEDCRCPVVYSTVFQIEKKVPAIQRQRWLGPLSFRRDETRKITCVEIISPTKWQKYENQVLVAEGDNSLQRLPLVHIQNTPDPLSYDACGDVEPLIPLQDELNTRLSDRANRITLTAFRMYLGKGIENFTDLPIAPGQMWSTDNPDAEVIEFGGTDDSPSEESHIHSVREALDKLSGTSPIAAGALKGRIGRLTSAAALRVTMLALLSRTERKRTTYGLAIAQLCELALAWLDKAGVFPTTPDERQIHIHWPNPVPVNEHERLDEAKSRLELGVPRSTVLRELGYPSDPDSQKRE
ncbi:MAG: hypothetical protein KatS3mg104_2592 [Phycisphaerae bacterium]|nr:MAG: hypothetical protein KatS3mg104_2592 [Phycisphaerae bacterium]